ncbi:PAS domain-containing protein [Rhizobium sp. Leaf371]|uniref:PAS domain-containing protein n=1 Tax=Rhizobium sp. Leaf371 TaxID=1736355 RepID=UPI00138F79B5|nr:PAS domain-containing protein [Rhizobium sp. Leaf371]
MKTRTSTDIFRYWQSLREKGRTPSRDQLDPGAIRDALPDVFILEQAEADQGRTESPRFRLAGTRLCALFVRELRGARLDSLWSAADMQDLAAVTRRVMLSGEPAVLQASGIADGERLAAELVLLPLLSRGGRHDRIFGSLTPISRPAWIGARPLPFLSIDRVAFPDRDLPVRNVAVRATVSRTFAAPTRDTALRQALSRVMHLSVMDGGKGR